MFGKPSPAPPYEGLELVRLALPRRVYTQSHMDYVCEVLIEIFKNRSGLLGLKMAYEAPTLRHFTAKFSRVTS
jgi:tryptophanase